MRSAFTLIELIFVIVIIGLLAAVAVPKFTNLKQSAEAADVVKNTIDAAQNAVSAAVNLRDLEDNSSFNLKDIVKLNGKNWTWSDDNKTSYVVNSNTIAFVQLHSISPGKIEYSIDCTQFSDTTTQDKCANLIGDTTNKKVDVNLTF